jgi:hypothetical protein
MGHDLNIICNHNLQTKTSKALALDINMRFNIPVKVYYQNIYDYEDCLNIKYSEINCTTILELALPNQNSLNKKIFFPVEKCIINDHSFQDLDAFEKYGKALLQTDEGKHLYENATIEYGDSPCFEAYLYITAQEEINFDVHHHVATPSLYFNPRWWSFSRILFKVEFKNSMPEDVEDSYQYLMEYRKRAFEFIKCIGGSEAFYVDDQGESYRYQDFATHHTWQETKDAIYTRYGTEVFNISKYIKSGETLKNPEYYPPIFYDDFADLQG